MLNCHSEIAQANIVKSAEFLGEKLGGVGLVITIIVEDIDNPDPSKGLHVCSNLSPDPKIQAAYISQVAHKVAERNG